MLIYMSFILNIMYTSQSIQIYNAITFRNLQKDCKKF